MSSSKKEVKSVQEKAKVDQAIKGLMDYITSAPEMDAACYAREQAWDVAQAAQILAEVAQLVTGEIGEPDDMAILKVIRDQLIAFIQSESNEIDAPDAGESNEMDTETMSLAGKAIAKREDVNPKAGKEKYGNVDFADEKNKKYPIDTEEHIRAAWNYISKSANADKYSAADVTKIKSKIVAAWKDKIDKAGPPSAKEDKSFVWPDDMLISLGSAVKALDDGTVTGYLVRYSSPEDPDLTGDFFTKNTDFGNNNESYTWYHHKLPIKTKGGGFSPAYKKQLGKSKAVLSKDDVGVFVKVSLDLRDEYEKAIYDMAKEGKLGWSSGTAPNLVEREIAGKAWFIKTWILGLDASLTPAPAEFRNGASIKSLITPEAALPDKDVPNSKTKNKEIKNMDELEVKAAVSRAVADALAERDAKSKAEAEAQAAHKAAVEEGYKMAVKDISERRAPAFNVIETSKSSDERNGGVDGFRHWIKSGQENSELVPAYGDPLVEARSTKAAFNVSTGGSGAFLVPDILYNIIQPKRDLQSWARQAPVQHFQTPADHLLVPVENAKMTAFTLTTEKASYTENEATVQQKDLVLYKYTKEVRMTEEFVNYNQTNFDAWLASALARAEAVTENTLFSIGPGGAAPEGVVTASSTGNTIATSAVIVPSDLTALVGKLGAGYNVSAESGFLMTNATKWYIKGVSTSGFFAFINQPAQGPVGSNYGNGAIGDPGVMGYPIFVSDDLTIYTDTSGTVAKTPVVFGNWSYYGVVERPGMMVQRNPYLHMDSGQISLFASIYRGGGVLQSEAFYALITK